MKNLLLVLFVVAGSLNAEMGRTKDGYAPWKQKQLQQKEVMRHPAKSFTAPRLAKPKKVQKP